MGNSVSNQSAAISSQVAITENKKEVPGEKPKACKACCACPDTKRVRDECIVSLGEENCQDLIEKHRECMRSMGFNI